MDRLTEKTVGCFAYDLKNFDHKIGEFGTYEAFFGYSMAVKKLGEYEDAEEAKAQQPKTNGDRIRAMSDEELAYWMTHLHEDGHCLNERCQIFQDKTCDECVLDWLKQPVKEEM